MAFEIKFVNEEDDVVVESFLILDGEQFPPTPLVGDTVTFRHADWKVTARSWWKLSELTIRLIMKREQVYGMSNGTGGIQ